MASGNEHVNMGLVVRLDGPYTAIARQKGPQQCCILCRVLQIPEQWAHVAEEEDGETPFVIATAILCLP
jgi:hypothetical protein